MVNAARKSAGKRGGSKPGERRGGRKAGTPNRATVELRQQLIDLGMGTTKDHPIVFMAKIAWGDVKAEVVTKAGKVVKVNAPLELRGRMAAEVASYLEPKRKAVEVSGPDGTPVAVNLVDLASLPSMTPEQRRAQQALLANPKLVASINQWLNKKQQPKKKGAK